MKARKLKQILNTDYVVHYCDGKICIASELCHDLISYDPNTKKIRYALDTFHEGRNSIKSDKLVAIWDKLIEMSDTGEINDILFGDDIIENPLPVFHEKGGKVYQAETDEYGYPNTTSYGELMYNNVFFKTFEEARNYGIEGCKNYIYSLTNRIKELSEDIKKLEDKKALQNSYSFFILFFLPLSCQYLFCNL